jgi:hypothetical protein
MLRLSQISYPKFHTGITKSEQNARNKTRHESLLRYVGELKRIRNSRTELLCSRQLCDCVLGSGGLEFWSLGLTARAKLMRLLTRQLRLHISLKRAQYSTYRGTGYCIETKTVIKAVLWIRTRNYFGRLDPDPHWEYRSGSVSRRAKLTHKLNKIKIFKC